MFGISYPTSAFIPHWGPPTATIDWCEENYLFTPYIAELINATTNFGFILLAVHHIVSTFRNDHGFLYIFISIGFASVGVGSFMFHSTLWYEHQLMDELPMVWVTAIPFGYIWGWNKPMFINIMWNFGTFIMTSLFTYIYIFIYRDPMFHQIFYALLNFGVIYKTIKTIKAVIPDETTRWKEYKLLMFSFSLFAFGFLIWNLDNIFCSKLIYLRRSVLGLPLGIFLEGHGWWHVFTGLGIYYFIAYNMILSTYMMGRGDQYDVIWKGFLIEVKKKDIKKQL